MLTPAAVYAYLLRVSRQRQAFFADTPQPEERVAILGGLPNLAEHMLPNKTIPFTKQHFKKLGLTWGMRLPKWLVPKNEFFLYTADPAIIQEIQFKKDIFHSRPSGMVFEPTIPLGLLALRSEGPHSAWAFHRRLVAPLFSDKFLQGYSEQVSQKADLLRYVLNERIKYAKGAQAECDLQLALKLITLDVISSIGFGFDSSSLLTYLPDKHPRALSKADAAKELESLSFKLYRKVFPVSELFCSPSSVRTCKIPHPHCIFFCVAYLDCVYLCAEVPRGLRYLPV